MTANDELDDELRRLFDDTRLDVRAREGAEEAVVAGARRIRLRRTALVTGGGALAAALLVSGSLALTALRSEPTPVALPAETGPGLSADPSRLQLVPSVPDKTTASDVEHPGPPVTPSSGAPDETATPRRPPSTVSMSLSPVPVIAKSVLGPTGYGKLALGMSFQDAKATGTLAGADTPPTGCATYHLSDGTSAVSSVDISPAGGIIRFTAGEARTPEGVEVGSTLAQLQAAYHDLAKGSATYTASAGPGGVYVFYLDDHNVVTSWQLIGPAATC